MLICYLTLIYFRLDRPLLAVWLLPALSDRSSQNNLFKVEPSNLTTVAPLYNEPRYNEDPVITNNIWKPGRITVKYVETNPAIMNPTITN